MAKTIEQTYKKLSQRDHILHRSDMYVGSKDLVTQEMWVASIKDFPEEIKIMKKLVTYSPAFIKCFDEVLTNASDHYWRGGGVKYIKIKFDGQCFEVENDGSGIPIQIHKDENVYVPELIFGHLLAGSNFDDSEERMGGGRNGSGSKLTNIFSTKFIVETADGKKKYKQTFKDNMEESKKSEPTITNSDENYTIIKYWPDLKQFNMTKIDDDTLSLILKRIIDISAYCPKVRVSWNGKNIPIKSIKDWMEMHIETPEDGTKREFFYEQIDKNWEIGIAKTTGMSFEQVSVVNGISTHRGGNHVNDISRELSKIIYEQLAKKNRKMKFTWMDVKNNIILFLICKVPNPIFDTQTKECLTNNLIKDNTISFNFSESLIKKILKSDICESIIEWLEAKEAQRLAKESIKNAKVKVQKLIDANSKSRKECILYVYEGDSAKSSFRKFRNSQTMGAFPLRGKFINVSEIPVSKVLENEEATGIMSSVGLHLGKIDFDDLRYGKIYISTDADVDGHSISAALINFFHKFWPEMYDAGMIYKVYTPLLVAKKDKQNLYFYTDDEFQTWQKKNDVTKWNIAYKKGLGALGDEEYKDMFTSPKAVLISKDEAASKSLDCWFGKNAELRKEKLAVA